ncbi:ADR403Cp [Eremothecium gossypii ATCC 10895]|uniref:ADR403Cp n=1 Tax=Eremothecium gossypii (strain ATCC 10895 / CBS 109.51 / FGSC 9923 / NRRL Y-1056) TaxID=284811 RepID=Q758X5_EREGS|nr:ADR403Cp [Eremothecium gossypii ATCC 10895]AAS52322.2 ADR403Cp [Eremothecium gossypii ATCC 10895]AEY96619.1 FADR403Cp [Eremothecium gossypii FDAG1]
MVKLEDMSSGQLSEESPDRKYVSKRNRISFVCQACRKSKTKCDREKPRCSRCAKNNVKCVYDIEKQRAPRVPSKDATIKRLTQELEYWKNKAARYMELEESGELSPRKRPKSMASDPSATELGLSEEYSSPSVGADALRADEIRINFYELSPQLLIKDSMKRDVKASCELSQIRQDKFLSIFLSSVFASASKNALIHSIPSDDASPYSDRAKRKQNALSLRDCMFQFATNSKDREQIVQFTERIVQGGVVEENRTGLYIRMFTSTLCKNYVEDRCPREGSYSGTLQELIIEVEAFLPPLEIIHTYMLHFYKYVYPIIPFLEMGIFESALANLLVEDPLHDGRTKLNIGRENIRNKVENIAILLMVLKLSYVSMSFPNTSPGLEDANITETELECLNSYPISDKAVALSQKAIATVNLFNWTNENCIACLLYFWAFFVFAPQDGDFCLGQPTEVILSLVNAMASNIGLHRDPSKYEQLNDPSVTDPRIRNYRRKLWICIFIVCRYEAALKGKYPQSMKDYTNSFLSAESPKNYMQLVLGDMQDPDPYTEMIHSLTYKRYQLLMMISELDEISIRTHVSLPLSRIETLLDNIQNLLDTELHADLINIDQESEFLDLNLWSGRKDMVDAVKIKKLIFFQAYMTTRLTTIRTVINLMLYFERLTYESNKEYMQYFQKYFIRMVKETVSFVDTVLSQLEYRANDSYLYFMKYTVDKVIQISVPTVLLSILSIILRMVHSEYLLQKMLQSGEMIGIEDVHTTKQKLELISSIKDNTIEILENLCTAVTRKLGFKYFSVFQMQVFFDYCSQIMKKGEVLNIFSRITQLTYHPRIRKGIYQGFGVDVDRKDTILNFLNDATFIKQTNVEQLRKIKELSSTLAQASSNTPQQNANVVNSKYQVDSSPISADHPTMTECENLPFPVVYDSQSILNVPTNNHETTQPFGSDFPTFASNQLDPLVSFDDLDLLDYEFLFGNGN